MDEAQRAVDVREKLAKSTLVAICQDGSLYVLSAVRYKPPVSAVKVDKSVVLAMIDNPNIRVRVPSRKR